MTDAGASTPEPEDGGRVASAPPSGRATALRLVLLVAVLGALYGVGKWTGVVDELSVDRIRELVAEAGAFGVVVYVLIFALGELVHVPGVVFVLAGLLAWGKVAGLPVALLGSVASVSVSFFVVRAVGGKALTHTERPFIKRILTRLDDRPMTTVFILRLVFFLAPALNYGLALTNVRYRDYVVGSTLGLLPALAGVALLFDWVLSLFS